jgi:DNA-binding transcriptional LysR family regulator
MLLALPAGHPAATDAEVSLDALRDAEWVEGAGEETPASLILHTACGDAGFRPRVAFNTGNFGVVQELVASGIGVALIPELALTHPHPGIAVRPVAETSPSRRVLLARRVDQDPQAERLCAALRHATHARRRAPRH